MEWLTEDTGFCREFIRRSVLKVNHLYGLEIQATNASQLFLALKIKEHGFKKVDDRLMVMNTRRIWCYGCPFFTRNQKRDFMNGQTKFLLTLPMVVHFWSKHSMCKY